MLIKSGLCKLFPQYPVLVLKLTPIYTVSLNTVFWIPQNQCYPETSCTQKAFYYCLQKNKILRPSDGPLKLNLVERNLLCEHIKVETAKVDLKEYVAWYPNLQNRQPPLLYCPTGPLGTVKIRPTSQHVSPKRIYIMLDIIHTTGVQYKADPKQKKIFFQVSQCTTYSSLKSYLARYYSFKSTFETANLRDWH